MDITNNSQMGNGCITSNHLLYISLMYNKLVIDLDIVFIAQ